MRFNVKALDVLHDFWVPAFRMKIDAVPGITTRYRMTPNRLGTYPVVCAELCGLGHSVMRSTAKVVTPAEFDAWMAKQKARRGRRRRPSGGEAARRRRRGRRRSTPRSSSPRATARGDGCGACHTLADAGTSSQTGPGARQGPQGQGRGLHPASRSRSPSAEIAAGFQDGIMPKNYGDTLSPEELDALVEYLGKVAGK